MSKLLNFIKRIFSSTINQIIITLLIPAVILMVFAFANNALHINNYENLIISNYTNELNSFLSDTEEKMNTIINNARLISTNPDVNRMLTTAEKPNRTSATSAISTLKQATNLVDIIDSISIYNKNANFIVSSNGLYHDANIYFDMIYSYENYNAAYWSDYHSIAGDIKILSPTVLKNDTSEAKKTIVPLVFTSLWNIASGNLVIFNIDVNTLFAHFEIYRLTPNSKVYMKDNTSGKIYSDSTFSTTDSTEYTFVQALKSSLLSNTDIISFNREKHLLIQSTDRSNMWGYTYLVIVPYSDIHDTSTKILFISIISVVVLFIGLMVFVLFGSKHLYVPWKKLTSIATSARTFHSPYSFKEGNVAEYVTNTILDITHTNKNLKQNLETTLPLSQEKYLIDILNNDVSVDNADSLLEPLAFKYDYFIAISINITINPAFLAEQPIPSAATISKKLHQAIHSVFANRFITYELPSTNDILYLLLNVENDLYIDEINETIDSIKNMLSVDNDNLEVIFGIGKIYKGFDGLKLTHQESVSSMIRALNSSKIQFSQSVSNKHIFSANSENILVNYLTLGMIDKSKELLNDIFENIVLESASAKQQVYCDIIIALRKVVRQKDMQSADLYSTHILEILHNNKTISYDEIQEQIFTIIDSIAEHMRTNSKKVNIEEIVSYINEHYTENLFLDEVAEKYNTTSKYLSKRIKQHLNVSFKDYITDLKINKAKELLENTDITIAELYTIVGFQDRNAFTRAFKQKTGLTPSDYKRHYNNKNSLA